MMAKPNRQGKVSEMWFTKNEKELADSDAPEVEYGPLYRLGWGFTAISMVWSLYCIQDLMKPDGYAGQGLKDIYKPGLIVGLAAEAFWGLVQYLNHRKINIGPAKFMMILGWATVAAVMGLLVWHGVDEKNTALAIAGPVVPLVAKIAWIGWDRLNLDRSVLTPEQQAALDDRKRERRYKAALAQAKREEERLEHEAKLAEIEMDGELALKQSDVDFKVMVDRQDKEAKLARKSPINIIPGYVERTTQSPVSVPSPAPQRVLPASRKRTNEITMNVTDLTEAQRTNKTLAAEWYIKSEADPKLTQAQFARDKGISGGQLSKILKAFSRDDAFEDDDQQLGA